jgi:hypothetical protein
MKNFNRNSFQLKFPQTIRKTDINPINNHLYRNQNQKYNSSTFCPNNDDNKNNNTHIFLKKYKKK